MAISESIGTSIVVKEYSTGVISSTAPVAATDPAATGGQVLRRTRANLNLSKNTFSSAEINTTRQLSDMRHGTRRVEGDISGELSGASYFSYITAVHRDTTPSGSFTALTQTTYTSLAADATAGTLTLGASDPVATGGLRVGDAITVSGLTAGNASNNATYVCLAFGGTSNRTITVSPAPAVTHTAATTFSIARPGRATIVPSSSHVQRKFAIEVVDSTLDYSRFFSEVRFSGYSISAPSEGMCTITLNCAGRDMTVLSGASSPFFSAPTAQTSTGIVASASGTLRVNGTNVAVVTGIDIQHTMAVTTPSVIGGSLAPDVILGANMITGTMTAFVTDGSMLSLFRDETAFEVIVTLPASDGSVISIYMPRVKLTGATIDLADGPAAMSLPFQALLYGGATTNGQVATSIRIVDSSVA